MENMIICVCGAGTMGSGIAQVSAISGFATIQFDVNADMLAKSKLTIEQSLDYLVSKEKITSAEKERALNRLTFTADPQACKAEIIIEAIVERLDAKVNLFNQLAAINSPATIFASNTSSISITDLQQQITGPDRVAGMHFFNPAHIMKLVEVVKGEHTQEQVVDKLYNLAMQLGKVPVHCKDAPGFIVNHVARTYYLEAMHLVESGLADIETVDAVMESIGFKMGPFRLMDLIGLDINYSVSQIVWEAMGKPDRLKPSLLQKSKVEAGDLGRKTGKGFYTY